jgi:hypothetical protein
MDELAENLRRYCQQAHACARHGRNYVMMPHGMLDPYSLRQKRWRKRIYLAASERRNLEGFSRLTFTTFHEQQAAREKSAIQVCNMHAQFNALRIDAVVASTGSMPAISSKISSDLIH